MTSNQGHSQINRSLPLVYQCLIVTALSSTNKARVLSKILTCRKQRCGSGMFIPDPGSEFFPSGIQDQKDSRIPDIMGLAQLVDEKSN
jgi:hypothetical protein